MEDIEFQGIAEKITTNPHEVLHEFAQKYPEENGYELGIPKIEDLGNGKFKVSIPVTKYASHIRLK